MSYALFVDDQQISRALPTEHDVWHYADEAGLVVDALIQDETGKPERILEQGYSIRQAETDQTEPDKAKSDPVKSDSVSVRFDPVKPDDAKPLARISMPRVA